MTIAGVNLPDKATYTFDDFMRLPEDARVELVRGQIVREPGPTYRHQSIQAALLVRMRTHADANALGDVLAAPLDVRLSDTETYHPDLLFLSNDRRDCIREQYVDGAPDLVVEILSPSTRHRTVKRETYEATGVREYWIVDPDAETVEVLANTESGFARRARVRASGAVTSTVLDGFELDVAILWT